MIRKQSKTHLVAFLSSPHEGSPGMLLPRLTTQYRQQLQRFSVLAWRLVAFVQSLHAFEILELYFSEDTAPHMMEGGSHIGMLEQTSSF